MKSIILFFKAPKKVSSRPVRKMVLFFKAEVKGHKRRLASGKIITVRPYWNKRGKEAKGNVEQDWRMENGLRNLVSAVTYDAARTTLQQRTLRRLL